MVDFLEELPSLDTEEMEDLYRHFLVDDMPEEDDGDEDFEPPAADEDEEGEEAGVRRRNVQARELSDLLQDAFVQLGPSAIPPGLRERVLDQMSMHFQLLIQTAVLSVTASSLQEEEKAVGMLEHLAHASCEEDDHRRQTRARGTFTMGWGRLGDGIPSVGVPGLLPGSTLKYDVKEAGAAGCTRRKSQEAVEQLMLSRGGVIWPQLVPRNTNQTAANGVRSRGSSCLDGNAQTGANSETSGLGGTRPDAFSMVEDRLLCRYAILTGWASMDSTKRRTPAPQGNGNAWTLDEDVRLESAVQARLARESTVVARQPMGANHEPNHPRGGQIKPALGVQVAGVADVYPDTEASLARASGQASTAKERPTTCNTKTYGASPSRSEVTPSMAGSQGIGAPHLTNSVLESPDGVTFAEDELSDDPDSCNTAPIAGHGTDMVGLEREERASQCGKVIVSNTCEAQVDAERALSGKRLFEEDELSDSDSASVCSGAAVLRRTRVIGK